jgi:hypothetical protein
MDFHFPKPIVPRQQAARAVSRGLRPLLQSVYTRIQDNFEGRRLFQTSILFLAIGGLGIFLGTRTRSAAVQPSAVYDLNSATSPVAQSSESSSERRVTPPVADLKSAVIPQTEARESSIESFKYVIQPKDTLRDLCMSMLGRYDSIVLSEIRVLNPDLKNPEHLHVGQEIRLPMSVTK